MSGATKKKWSYANIPGVPGCTYYLTVKGQNRTLICTEMSGRKVTLSDLSTGYLYKWDISHFSYMLRTSRWRDTQAGPTSMKIEVEHTQKKESTFSERSYSEEELSRLVDNIDDVDF